MKVRVVILENVRVRSVTISCTSETILNIISKVFDLMYVDFLFSPFCRNFKGSFL